MNLFETIFIIFCLCTMVICVLIVHFQETQWDHPEYTDLTNAILEFNIIKFSAYRLAMKLRAIQRKLRLDLLDIEVAHRGFEEHGLTADRHEVLNNANYRLNLNTRQV